ncbi:DUF4350 domain-containing protein [Microbacterium enclense]|uniref:DUF4350 domain-containing protein n=1 Tax=Microbacterium enclense TaxID=993073 RepID=A0A3S4M459_9MICO|nr:DUF4350 domain-containing protein [Microbacterium enclense]RWR22243.1 DUF4350 domain-containing protein [Microbacterium enclense]
MTAVLAPPTRRRVGAGWIALIAALGIVGLLGTLLVFGGWTPRDALDPAAPAPDGTRAVTRLLEQQGVRVVVARDLAAAERELAAAPATLVMRDAPTLSDATLERLAESASDVVLIEPRSRSLDVLLAGSSLADVVDDRTVEPSCETPAARTAGPARTGELYLPGDGVTGCYPTDGGFGVLVRENGAGTVTAVDGFSVLTNRVLPLDGNAALALGLLGGSPTVVWYVPSPADADTGAEVPTIGDLTPPWVTPVMVLLLVAGVAAALWRGRRFGPLVTERLPVTVRANETTEGRARLYAASGDAAHALDELRRATRRRLVRRLGMSARTPAGQLADAVAERLGADRAVVHGILIDDLPHTDRDLVAASDRLRDLETSVDATLRTERTPR